MAFEAAASVTSALRDLAHALVDYIHLNLFGRQLDERVAQCLHRAVHVALHDHVQFVEVAQSQSSAHLVQRQHLLRAQALFTLQLFAFVGDLAGLLLGVEHMEGVACGGSAVQAQDEGCLRGARLLDALVTLVEHRLHLTVRGTGQHDVAHVQCTVRHQDGGYIATALVEGRFDHRTRSLADRGSPSGPASPPPSKTFSSSSCTPVPCLAEIS